ncbi:unnamed protein product [Orchesella dallaii]|uniref:BTB domain-containing protein n=1 Tax=Orchesella dallaii TaxID=48710 RepID=A0ABP1QQU1_9HEXA
MSIPSRSQGRRNGSNVKEMTKPQPGPSQRPISSNPSTSTYQRVMNVHLVKDQKISVDYMRMVGGNAFSFARSWSFSLLGMNRPAERTELPVDIQPADASEETLQFCADIKRKTIGLGGEAYVQQAKYEQLCVSFHVKSFDEERNKAVLTVRVEGPFATRLLSEYQEPLKMTVRAQFESEYQRVFKQRVVCKDMKPQEDKFLRMGEQWFENDVEVDWFAGLVKRTSEAHLARVKNPDHPPWPFDKAPPINTKMEGYVTIELIGDLELVLGWIPPCDNEFLCRRFLEEGKFSDFTLISENDENFHCHKLFLGGHSPVFAAMFETECKETREKSCKMQLSSEGVKALLKFIYYSNIDDALGNSSVALELLATGHQYCIAALENSMKGVLLGKPVDWFDKEVALLLFIRARKLDNDYVELKKKAVQIIKAKGTELNMSNVMDEILKEDPESAKELMVLLSTTT